MYTKGMKISIGQYEKGDDIVRVIHRADIINGRWYIETTTGVQIVR